MQTKLPAQQVPEKHYGFAISRRETGMLRHRRQCQGTMPPIWIGDNGLVCLALHAVRAEITEIADNIRQRSLAVTWRPNPIPPRYHRNAERPARIAFTAAAQNAGRWH